MQVMLGMLPMLVKEMKGERGKGSQQRKGGKDLREDREKIWGKKCLKGERGEKIFGRKREIFLWGEQALRGNRISNGKGGKRRWEVISLLSPFSLSLIFFLSFYFHLIFILLYFHVILLF